MNSETLYRLIELNRQFYQTFAGQFSATRQRLQLGVLKAVQQIPAEAAVLDIGCGNGELWRYLQARGHSGPYMGLDFSAELLAEAQEGLSPRTTALFFRADLSTPHWHSQFIPHSFDFALAFAVLHHLPGRKIRQAVIQAIHLLLKPGGYFIHSHWNFMHSPRLVARIQPWETIHLSPDQVDPNDYLLDWRRGGYGLRYVHHFDERELNKMAEDNQFRVLESYFSDGEGSKLGLYQIWKAM